MEELGHEHGGSRIVLEHVARVVAKLLRFDIDAADTELVHGAARRGRDRADDHNPYAPSRAHLDRCTESFRPRRQHVHLSREEIEKLSYEDAVRLLEERSSRPRLPAAPARRYRSYPVFRIELREGS